MECMRHKSAPVSFARVFRTKKASTVPQLAGHRNEQQIETKAPGHHLINPKHLSFHFLNMSWENQNLACHGLGTPPKSPPNRSVQCPQPSAPKPRPRSVRDRPARNNSTGGNRRVASWLSKPSNFAALATVSCTWRCDVT